MSTDKIAQDGGGLRYNEGKLPWYLLPLDAIRVVLQVFAYGGKKYAPRNWERGQLYSVPYASLMRHLSAWWQDREVNDPESGLHHLGHVVWNALALLTYVVRGIPNLDDRPAFATPAAPQPGKLTVDDYDEMIAEAERYLRELREKQVSLAVETVEAEGQGIRVAFDYIPASPSRVVKLNQGQRLAVGGPSPSRDRDDAKIPDNGWSEDEQAKAEADARAFAAAYRAQQLAAPVHDVGDEDDSFRKAWTQLEKGRG
jgi:hypothetical protein